MLYTSTSRKSRRYEATRVTCNAGTTRSSNAQCSHDEATWRRSSGTHRNSSCEYVSVDSAAAARGTSPRISGRPPRYRCSGREAAALAAVRRQRDGRREAGRCHGAGTHGWANVQEMEYVVRRVPSVCEGRSMNRWSVRA
eukprot:360380-Chlamydomonas_euryale.AAC.10